MRAFFAYPSTAVVSSLARAVADTLSGGSISIHSWEENDVSGRPLLEPILDNIDSSDFLIADITYLNFNVAFEIGYAIAKRKRCLLLCNTGLRGDMEKIRQVGIFDTLGYVAYENARSAVDIIRSFDPAGSIDFDTALDQKTPVYLLETPVKNEAMTFISSRLKKTRLRYRSFNPDEQIRLAALEGAQQVAKSFGVLIPLLSSRWMHFDVHNIRAAYVAGLAVGLERVVSIIQEIDGPFPLDVIDVCHSFRQPDEIADYIGEFAVEVTERLQGEQAVPKDILPRLANLNLGNPVAENEFESLSSYFIDTDEYGRAVRGEVNLVVGRKGTGKTALFIQVRNQKRRKVENVIVDLKPEGYQLVEMRDEVLHSLAKGAKEHLIVAFWEYVIYLEIIRKVLEKDKTRHVRDHSIFEIYREFSQKYADESRVEGADFSERLLQLSKRITEAFKNLFGDSHDVRLDRDSLTNILRKVEIQELREDVKRYLKLKGETWLLFDNLDKGWPPTGLTPDDALILRCLIESARKVQNDLRVSGLRFFAIVFVRDDVYDILIRNTPDYGKEIRVQLDWTDTDLMRELVRARLASALNEYDIEMQLEEIWSRVCVSHTPYGDETLEYMIEFSLRRPRNILKIIDRCKGAAINARHERIEYDDIVKGLASYSNDLLIEADREIMDILPSAENLLYKFIDEPSTMTSDDFRAFVELQGYTKEDVQRIVTYFLYFGIIGIDSGFGPKYVWDFRNNMKLVHAALEKAGGALSFSIHPAFQLALGVR